MPRQDVRQTLDFARRTGDTAVDVVAAVLHAEPPELGPDLRVPAALDRIIRRCLEKRAEEVAKVIERVNGIERMKVLAGSDTNPQRW